MARVWELDLPHNQKWVLLALADIADDDGTHCYPSVDYLAWKTDYSDSQVRRIMSQLRKSRLIVPVAFETGGRGKSTHYHLHLENGSQKLPFVPAWERERREANGDEEGKENPSKMTPFAAGSVENHSTDARVSAAQNPRNMTGFSEVDEGNPSAHAQETLAPETETLAPVRENPSIAMTDNPSGTVTEPSGDPGDGPDLLSAKSGDGSAPAPEVEAGDSAENSAAGESSGGVSESSEGGPEKGADVASKPKFGPPDYWTPMMALDGYAPNRNHGRFVKILEETCASQGVSPAEVVAKFAEYYAANRFRHGWSDPVASLRRTLPKQISVILKGRANGSQGRSLHERRIEAEKRIPIRDPKII